MCSKLYLSEYIILIQQHFKHTDYRNILKSVPLDFKSSPSIK